MELDCNPLDMFNLNLNKRILQQGDVITLQLQHAFDVDQFPRSLQPKLCTQLITNRSAHHSAHSSAQKQPILQFQSTRPHKIVLRMVLSGAPSAGGKSRLVLIKTIKSHDFQWQSTQSALGQLPSDCCRVCKGISSSMQR